MLSSSSSSSMIRFGQSKDYFASRKNKVPFSMAIARKWGTHALVFSQTLEHGNSKTEIR